MINILHIISDTNIGGAGTHVIALTKALNKKKYNVYILCPVNAKISKMADQSVTVIEAPIHPDSSFNMSDVLKIKKIIKQYKIDIVHTHASFSGRIAGKITGAKIVYSKHTPSIIHKKRSIKWFINKWLNNFFSDKVIAVSNYISKQLIDLGMPQHKISTIYNGIDAKFFEVSLNIKGIKDDYKLTNEFILLEIARLEPGKGHEYLFEAISLLSKEQYNIKAIIVGGGSRESELKSIAHNLNIEDKVIFTGVINDIRPIVTISDVVVLPSLKEALGIALLEGMCMSKPCIGSNIDGIPEVIDHKKSGILVKPKDTEELKNAIITLYNNEELRTKYGQQGKKLIYEKFSIEKMTIAVENLYDGILL